MPEAARHRLLPRHHARAGDGGAKFTAPRARGPRRCGSCPGLRAPVTALPPVPAARAPGPALDLTPALSLAGGRALVPRRRFQTLPHSQTPRARGAAPGHDPPAGPPQSRAGAGSSGLEGPPLAAGIAAVAGIATSPRAGIAAPGTARRPPARRWGPLSERLLCPTAITSSRAFPHGPPPPGPRDPRARSGAAAPMAASAALSSSSEDTLICLLRRRFPPSPRFGFNPW